VSERDAARGRLLGEIQGLRTIEPVIVGTGTLEGNRVRPVEGMTEKLSRLAANPAPGLGAFIVPAGGAGAIGERRSGAPAPDPGCPIVPVETLDEALEVLFKTWWEHAEAALAGLTRYLDSLSEDALAELEMCPAVREDWGEKNRRFHDESCSSRRAGSSPRPKADRRCLPSRRLLAAVIRILPQPAGARLVAGQIPRSRGLARAPSTTWPSRSSGARSGSRRSSSNGSPAPSDVGRAVRGMRGR
jgi:hypothetical protein